MANMNLQPHIKFKFVKVKSQNDLKPIVMVFFQIIRTSVFKPLMKKTAFEWLLARFPIIIVY